MVGLCTKIRERSQGDPAFCVEPAQAQIVRNQRQEVQDLLNQLDAGRRVDPAEVDRVLQQAERPF
jgi:hypothetical protein